VPPRRLADLTDHELDTRDRAAHAIALMRRDGLSLTRAGRIAGTKPSTVRHYFGPAFKRDGRRWKVTASDTIPRRQVTIISGSDGQPTRAVVETRSSRQASEIGKHNSDISALLSIRTSPDAREEARARIAQRQGKRAGLRAFLSDGSLIKDPQFFGTPEEIVDAYDTLDLGDIDYGSSASTRDLR
jgi:hypothetical protein